MIVMYLYIILLIFANVFENYNILRNQFKNYYVKSVKTLFLRLCWF